MRTLLNRLPRAAMVLGLSSALIAPQISFAQERVSEAQAEDPSPMAMMGDLVVARPMLLIATVGGTLAYVVSLPFTLAGGNAKQAGEKLVVGPAKATFVRCLGCTKTGKR